MQVSKNFLITENLVGNFAQLSGDSNPIHISKEYARKTKFKKPIAHGMLIGALISSMIAKDLPGEGSIYLSQNLKFIKPVYVGTEAEIIIRIIECKKEKPLFTLETNVYVDSVCTVEGLAVVFNERYKKIYDSLIKY